MSTRFKNIGKIKLEKTLDVYQKEFLYKFFNKRHITFNESILSKYELPEEIKIRESVGLNSISKGGIFYVGRINRWRKQNLNQKSYSDFPQGGELFWAVVIFSNIAKQKNLSIKDLTHDDKLTEELISALKRNKFPIDDIFNLVIDFNLNPLYEEKELTLWTYFDFDDNHLFLEETSWNFYGIDIINWLNFIKEEFLSKWYNNFVDGLIISASENLYIYKIFIDKDKNPKYDVFNLNLNFESKKELKSTYDYLDKKFKSLSNFTEGNLKELNSIYEQYSRTEQRFLDFISNLDINQKELIFDKILEIIQNYREGWYD